MEYKVKKTKIKGMTLYVEMEETIVKPNGDRIINDVKKDSDQLIHPDLQKAFDDLIIHLIMICDQKEDGSAFRILAAEKLQIEIDKFDKDQVAKYGVSGFVIGGEDANGVTLIGHKTLEDGKVINLISPFSKYEDYKNGQELSLAIESCIYEVEQYLFEGKCAEDNQMKIPFDESFEEGESKTTFSINGGPEVSIDTLTKAAKKLTKKAVKEAEPTTY